MDVASCRWLRCAAFGCSLLSRVGLVVSPTAIHAVIEPNVVAGTRGRMNVNQAIGYNQTIHVDQPRYIYLCLYTSLFLRVSHVSSL